MESPVQTKTTLVYLETFGCQSNALESLHLSHLLRKGEFTLTGDVEEADVVLFNGCSVRQHAEDKVMSRLGLLGDWKRRREGRVLGVLGCMATEHKEKLIERVPHLDLVLGPDQYPRVAEALRRSSGSTTPTIWADFDPEYFPEAVPSTLPQKHRAFVEIMKGCDKFCTFCIVPFTRGREVSRPPSDILQEVARLVDAGVKEVTLLGQNVNSYGTGLRGRGAAPPFAELVRRVGAVPGLKRLRFMTPHPLDLSDDLADAFADTPALCEYLHLPLQSGSDRILKFMNRKYTAEHFLGRVRRLKAARPDLALSTDLIAGFPGETDVDFQATLDLMDAVKFDLIYSFKFSPRAGTPAARMLNPVGERLKEERLALLNEKGNAHAAERAAERIGRVEEVLVEGEAERTPGAFYGKTRQNRQVIFPARDLPAGSFVDVRITGRRVAALLGGVIS